MKQPNILYIMSDDHSANAIGCYDSLLAGASPTPNIDRIGREGVRLENCFCTNAICTPSRAVILTGQHSHVNGVYTLKDGLDPSRRTVAPLLQAAGYQTAIVGKWHLHTQPQGFDYYNVLPGHPTQPNVWQAKIDQDIWQLFVDDRMMINARWPNADHPFENEERSN